MKYLEVPATREDGEGLAHLRVLAMKESLVALGRFEPARARERFLASFEPSNTVVLLINNVLVGFYVIEFRNDHLWINHFYIHPDKQGCGVGGSVLQSIIRQASDRNLPVRLGALRGSRSNGFYKRHGFHKTHEEEWDIYYELNH